MPIQKLIAKSKNGVSVMYDPIGSHAATHLEDTPPLKELVAEIVQNLMLEGQEVKRHFNMGRVIGTCDVVKVDKRD